MISQIQDEMARNFISTLPLLTGKQIAVAGKDIDGILLDKSFKFQFAPLENSAQKCSMTATSWRRPHRRPGTARSVPAGSPATARWPAIWVCGPC